MKFSLYYLPSFHEGVHTDSATLYQQILEECVLGDQIGLDRVWCAEHHLHRYGGDLPHPCLMLAAIAARTERIGLGTGGVALPLHAPLELAEQLAMVDALSGGRLEIGIVRAFLPFEYEAYQIDMGESRARFEEHFDVIRELFANEQVSFNGRFTTLRDVTLRPQPVQRHPSFTLGAVMTRESFEFAGRHGLNLMVVPYVAPLEAIAANISIYHDALREAGYDPATRNVMGHCFYFGDPDASVAKETPREAMLNYLASFRDAVSGGRWSPDYKGYDGLAGVIESLMDYELIYRERSLFAHPDKFHQKVTDLRQAGITEIAMTVNLPGIAHPAVMRSLEFLGKEILPEARSHSDV